MPKFDVYVFAVARLPFLGLQAQSKVEAIEQAWDKVEPNPARWDGEYTDEDHAYLVDVLTNDGQVDYAQATWYEADGETPSEKLVEPRTDLAEKVWLATGQRLTDLEATILALEFARANPDDLVDFYMDRREAGI